MKKVVYDFDSPFTRLDTDSVKWDKYSTESAIPLWVADMDFRSPPCVISAIAERVSHGVLGYTHPPFELHELISNYLFEQYKWKVDPEWIILLPNVLSGLYCSVRSLTESKDHIVIPSPIYNHFKRACISAQREFSKANLTINEDRSVLTANSLNEAKNKNSKLLLFCNPQNPGGTVYKKDELHDIAEFCIKNNILLCSDEIHSGLILDQDSKHLPIASIDKEISRRTITLMSLNKTFNFSGCGMGWMVIENSNIRKIMQEDLNTQAPINSIFGYISTKAAILQGEEWRKKLIEYLRENRSLVQKKINAISSLKIYKNEATYLAWIDCKNMQAKNPFEFFLKKGVALMPGDEFDAPDYLRLNFATQRQLLNQALDRMTESFMS